MTMLRYAAFILVAAATIQTASAASQKAYDDCNSPVPERRIPGCTVVIQDSSESQKNRGTASLQRGLAYERNGEFDRAIADLNEAIKQNINVENVTKRRDLVLKKKQHIDRATPDLGSLDGTWEGELSYRDKNGDAKTMWRRLVINGTDGQVFYRSDDKTEEVKPNTFRVHRHLTNAVVVAIDSALDDEGLWIETWSFAVTLKDRNTLLTSYSRMVNNANLPLSVSHSKFASEAAGELKRK